METTLEELVGKGNDVLENIPLLKDTPQPLEEKFGVVNGDLDADYEKHGTVYRDGTSIKQRARLTRESAIGLAVILEKQLSEDVITGNWLKKCNESTTDVVNLQKTIEVYRAAIVALAMEV